LGILGLVVVDLFARTTVHMTQWALGFGAPDALLGALFQGGTVAAPPAARGLHVVWLSFVGLVAPGWIYSYFWTAAAIMYLVLRAPRGQPAGGTPLPARPAPDPRLFDPAHPPPPDPLAPAAHPALDEAQPPPSPPVASDASALS